MIWTKGKTLQPLLKHLEESTEVLAIYKNGHVIFRLILEELYVRMKALPWDDADTLTEGYSESPSSDLTKRVPKQLKHLTLSLC